jgi:hypothetical protein
MPGQFLQQSIRFPGREEANPAPGLLEHANFGDPHDPFPFVARRYGVRFEANQILFGVLSRAGSA